MNKLIVISVDALNSKDLNYISNLKNFKSFIDEGSLVKSVDAVYPSMTYCCHSSIITGTYPMTHGIFHNEVFNPAYHMVQDWYWYKKSIKVPTLFDLAKEQSLSTAAVLWPVMANAKKAIDYNIPEIWSDRGKSSFGLFLKNGSLKLLPLVLKHSNKLNGKKQPFLDNFSEAISIDIIKSKQPDFMAIHLTELDSTRHEEGVFSDVAYRILDKMDERIGRIIESTKLAKTYDTTNFVLLGDHGGNDFTHIILLNSLFHNEGLIEQNDDGSIKSWKAYANTCGGSVQIHLKDPSDSVLYNQVYDLLSPLLKLPNQPITHLFTKEDTLLNHRLSGSYSFALEANNGYIFRNHIKEKYIIPRTDIDHAYHCDHGFLPSHPNMKTLFLAKGPNIQRGTSLETGTLVDEGPTLAALLSLKIPNPEGTAFDILDF